jgi:hypothetical protein
VEFDLRRALAGGAAVGIDVPRVLGTRRGVLNVDLVDECSLRRLLAADCPHVDGCEEASHF